jgi:tRNA dimethylallyltransferase
MSPDSSKPLVIMIVGSTGVGKTGLAIELASAINGEIISADSRYLYRGMDIGTAKPSTDERNGIPHHLIDTADPDQTWTLADFLDRTLELIEKMVAAHKVPIIVGGTGQYMRALTEGWSIPTFETDENLRRELNHLADEIGKEQLHQKLAIVDPEAAGFVDPTNVRRTIRALEVILSTGQKFSSLRVKEGPAYDFWIIGLCLERELLYARIDSRIEQMFERGLVDEVKRLLALGYTPDLPSMSAIGYQEVSRFLKGDIDLETAKALMRKRTRQFVRRQTNWFKPTDPSIRWYSMQTNPISDVIKDLTEYLLMRGHVER